MTHDRGDLLRWAASLHRTSQATQAEAAAHGPQWEYYALSLRSAAAQRREALTFEAMADQADTASAG